MAENDYTWKGVTEHRSFMKALFTSKSSEILHIEDDNIIIIRFIGDISDEAYFEIWEQGLILMVDHACIRMIMDQSLSGHVSYAARSKVVREYVQQYKKKIDKNAKVGVLTSENEIHNAGVKYLVEIFRSQTPFKIEFFNAENDAIEWLISDDNYPF